MFLPLNVQYAIKMPFMNHNNRAKAYKLQSTTVEHCLYGINETWPVTDAVGIVLDLVLSASWCFLSLSPYFNVNVVLFNSYGHLKHFLSLISYSFFLCDNAETVFRLPLHSRLSDTRLLVKVSVFLFFLKTVHFFLLLFD